MQILYGNMLNRRCSNVEEIEERESKKMNSDILIQSLENEDLDKFRNEFLALHPYDQAKFYTGLDSNLRTVLYHFLSPEELADLFENIEVDEEDYENLLAEMNPSYVAEMLSHMYADDAADVLSEINDKQAVSYLTIMDNEAANEIQGLLNYEESTAGSIMTTEFVALEASLTVRLAMQYLKREAPMAETIYYTFVTDHDKKLLGVLS